MIISKIILHVSNISAIIQLFPLSKGMNSWRIKQPQALTKKLSVIETISLVSAHPAGTPKSKNLGAWIGSLRKSPLRCLLSSLWHCFAATRSAFSKYKEKALIMLYTFLIAHRKQAITALNRIRTISAIADTEHQARKQLKGLPLVFVRRTQLNGVA